MLFLNSQKIKSSLLCIVLFSFFIFIKGDVHADVVTSTISLPTSPSAITNFGSKVYVTGYTGSQGFITSIDTSNANATSSVNVQNQFNQPITSVVTSSGIYVESQAHLNPITITFIDNNNTVSSSTVFAPSSELYAIGQKVYAPLTNQVLIIDGANNNATTSVGLGSSLFYGTILGSKIYFTNQNSSIISVIDTGNNNATSSISLGLNPFMGSYKLTSIASTSKVYISNSASNTVSVIDTLNNNATSTIGVGGNPKSLTVLGSKVYVANYNDNTVSIIDTLNNNATSTVTVGGSPTDIIALRNKVYVANQASSTVSVIDTANNNSVSTLSVGAFPVALTALGSNVFVANQSGMSVSVITASPQILSFQSSPVATSSVISWLTDSTTNSQINYGLSSLYSASSTLDSNATTTHSQILTNLLPCTEYHYQIKSIDTLSFIATSSDSSFITMGCTGNSVVSTSTSSTITTGSGGTLSLGGTTIIVPSGFTSTSSTVLFQEKSLDPSTLLGTAGTPSGVTLIGNTVVNLKAIASTSTIVSTFNSPITVTLSYVPSDVVNIDVSSLKIYRYDGSSWTPLSSCSTDNQAHTVSCQTSNFSDFAIFGSALAVAAPVSSGGGSTGGSSSGSSGGGGGFATASIAQNTTTSIGTVVAKKACSVSSDLFDVNTGMPCYLSTPAFIFLHNLSWKMRNPDVLRLQQYLNSKGFNIASSGAGSIGHETFYFGLATKSALIKFQLAHSIKPASGFFGPLTRAYISSMK